MHEFCKEPKVALRPHVRNTISGSHKALAQELAELVGTTTTTPLQAKLLPKQTIFLMNSQ